MRRGTASALAHSDTPQAARLCGGRHLVLEAMADRRDWERDARANADELRRLCGEPADDATRWRAALVEWRPEEIAGILTQLTGRPVHADRVRHTLLDGRVTLAHGRVSLGEVADAMRL